MAYQNIQDKIEYQKWYYENVTKPKRYAQNPDRKPQAPMRKLGAPTTRRCEYPACENEYVSNKPEKHYCSPVCKIRHLYDKKHGVERKFDEDYCPGCKQVYHISKFPPNKAAVSGRLKYCKDCQNEKVRRINKEGYKNDPERFLDAQKRYHQKKKSSNPF